MGPAPSPPEPSPGHGLPSALAALIQPHGVTLILQIGPAPRREEAKPSTPSPSPSPGSDRFTIVAASCNTTTLLDCPPEDLIGCPLVTLLDSRSEESITLLGQDLRQAQRSEPCYLPLELTSGRTLEGWLHWVGTEDGTDYWPDYWLLELEPLWRMEQDARRIRAVRTQMARLQRLGTVTDLLQEAAIALQQLTQMERVLIYQFGPEGHGTVIAEVTAPRPTPQDRAPRYLGLRFPASDIPTDSRQHYAQGSLRYVPHLHAEPVGFVALPPTFPAKGWAYGVLRAVDPCCVAYHSNMNVAAFLVIPLVIEGNLWGLMVGHHSTPVTLPVSVRLDGELLGQTLAASLAQQNSQQALRERERLKGYQSDFLAAIARSDDLISALTQPELRLLGLTNAQGAAILFEDDITLVGTTPSPEAIADLYSWITSQQVPTPPDNTPYHTNTLPQQYPPAQAYKDIASGILILTLSPIRRYAIIWFRPEVLQTVQWASNPAHTYPPSSPLSPPAEQAPAEQAPPQLCPRDSFARWQETVRLTALPWQPWEITSALDLRHTIVGIVLHKADELARLNRDLERSNQELASFIYAASHDLKEPLRGINNYAKLLLQDNQSQLNPKSSQRLQTLIQLSRRMAMLIDALLGFSRVGQADMSIQAIDLNPLVARALDIQALSRPEVLPDIHIPRPLPPAQGDPTLLEEVYSNLLSNAIKYTDHDTPWIEIGYYDATELAQEPRLPPELCPPVFYVRDNGIGIPPQHWTTVFELFRRLYSQKRYGGGTGIGLTIAKKIVERHGGQIGLYSDSGGTTFYWTLGTTERSQSGTII